MDKKEINTNFLKNPIGVIGFFLVLVEAIASLVVAYSNLCEYQNTILVLFIVLFPCIVLAVFHNLVTQHHQKLYSPSDYRDEQNFVGTYDKLTQKDVMMPVSNTGYKNLQQAETNNNLVLIKNAVADILEVQKRMIPVMEEATQEKIENQQMVSSLRDYLDEIDLDNDSHETGLHVEVSPLFKSTKFVRELKNKGYKAAIYRFWGMGTALLPNADHQAIWLGANVPVEMATDVIRTAKKYYPHLKYIEISDCSDGAPEHMKDLVFIGGATSTARENGLKPLSEANFEQLYKMKSSAALHAYVRKFK